MLERQFTQCMLRPSDLQPSQDNLEVVGVFNPGAVEFDGGVLLLARVVEQATEQRDGQVASPRYEDGGVVIDWLDEDKIDPSDPRLYQSNCGGLTRLRFISHLRVFHSHDGKTIDLSSGQGQIILPETEYETYGIEDPRITKIGGTFYITYVGVSPHGITTQLMSTTGFTSFKRHGVIFCPDNKDVVLLPEKIVGDYFAIHRPMPSMPLTRPEMWIARSPDLVHWGGHKQLMGGGDCDGIYGDRVGGGSPPIKTDRGWMTIFHGAAPPKDRGRVGAYSAGVLLLDKDNPEKVVAMTHDSIMGPAEDFEKSGFVDNVVFPTAVIRRSGMFYVYYGAADESLGVVGFDIEQLLAACEAV
jgi:predicted GH43/DUF377 family glycosyl hydrolase